MIQQQQRLLCGSLCHFKRLPTLKRNICSNQEESVQSDSIVLNDDDFETLLDLIENPRPVSDKLLESAKLLDEEGF
jgi:hypothetical protein